MGMWGALAGAGLGVIQHGQKEKEFERQRQLAAEMERYSPWTGVHGTMPGAKPNMIQDVGQGALAGGTMGMNMTSANSANDLNQAKIANLNAQTNGTAPATFYNSPQQSSWASPQQPQPMDPNYFNKPFTFNGYNGG